MEQLVKVCAFNWNIRSFPEQLNTYLFCLHCMHGDTGFYFIDIYLVSLNYLYLLILAYLFYLSLNYALINLYFRFSQHVM